MKALMTFSKKIDLKNRDDMAQYLADHFRYDTMNSWNASTSYANNLKIYKVIPHKLRDNAYGLLEIEGSFDTINFLCEDFDREHDYQWQVGFNGRSGGYLVLYQGGKHPDCSHFTYSGKSLDMGMIKDDYLIWELNDLQDRVKLVQEFDKLCDDIVAEFIHVCESFEVEEKEIQVTKKVKVLVEK